MSAMGGVIPVRSPAEIESGSSGKGERDGVVIRLPIERPAQVEPSRHLSLELEPLSPELALVDPELARAARELLPDRPRFAAHAAVPAVFVERLDHRSEPTPGGRLGRFLSVAALVALGAMLTLLVGRAPLRPQIRSVAGVEHSTVTPATPVQRPAKPASSPVHSPPLAGQTFVWVATPGASAYEFQLFQSGERIFRARVAEPRLALPGRWRQNGRPYALVPGDYRWYVWPVSSQTKRQSSVAIVQAKLVIERHPR